MVLPEFSIFEVTAGGGTLALSPLPGRSRHYAADFARLLAWDPALVVTMCTMAELERKGAGGLGEDCAACGIDWRHLPVVDFDVPGEADLAEWDETAALAREHLGRGRRVLFHCFGGCGRSGMAVLRLLVELGEAPEAALARLRAVRPCAVETEAQFGWATGGRTAGRST